MGFSQNPRRLSGIFRETAGGILGVPQNGLIFSGKRVRGVEKTNAGRFVPESPEVAPFLPFHRSPNPQ
jgi:hypothetical protein